MLLHIMRYSEPQNNGRVWQIIYNSMLRCTTQNCKPHRIFRVLWLLPAWALQPMLAAFPLVCRRILQPPAVVSTTVAYLAQLSNIPF